MLLADVHGLCLLWLKMLGHASFGRLWWQKTAGNSRWSSGQRRHAVLHVERLEIHGRVCKKKPVDN